MHKPIQVEEATRLMEEAARDWSIWRWLFSKSRVRAAADRAVDALGEAEKKVKACWSVGTGFETCKSDHRPRVERESSASPQAVLGLTIIAVGAFRSP